MGYILVDVIGEVSTHGLHTYVLMDVTGEMSTHGNPSYRPHLKDGGRYCFQFVSSHLRGVSQSGLGEGGTPSQVWLGGYPIPGLAREIPHPRSRRGEGVPHPRSGWGGTQGTPPTRSGWVTPPPGMGSHLDLGQGTPQTWDRVAPLDLGQGTPPRPGT